MLYRTPYGNWEVEAKRSRYSNNGNLAIQLITPEGEPVSTLTVNIMDGVCEYRGEEYAYVDTNNNPTGVKFILENELGEPTGEVGYSGFCEYPLYRFNLDKLKEDK